ncbi:MAG: response regulator [Methanospirillaceae archaeon]|nr:response regulator [Methanospirillaceae archaeon]
MEKNVLIVDDEPALNELFVIGLSKYGFFTKGVLGGSEALEILQTFHPDVILLDIMMEPMDGWETLRHIKKNQDLIDIPIIMQTGKNLTFQEAEQYCFDIDYYLMKPITPKYCVQIIDDILKKKDRIQEIASQALQKHPVDDVEKFISLHKALSVTDVLENLLDNRYSCDNANDSDMYGAKEFSTFRDQLREKYHQLQKKTGLII